MKRIFVFFCVLALFANLISVSAVEIFAESAIVINARTRGVIYSKDAHQKRAMASTTKIMTALILAECNTPHKTVVITKEMVAVEGSSMGLKVGDEVTYSDLLYGILLPSGNDAANAAAIAVAGSIKEFAVLMNNRAKELNLKNTNFVTPSGLDAQNHYTTAYDLALLTSYALENEEFRKVASTKSVVLEYNGQKHYLSNHNKLLKTYEGAIGVKTGYTSKSGRCLVSAAKRGGAEIIVVTLNDKNDWQDHATLLDLGFDNTNEIAEVPKTPNTVAAIGGNIESLKIVSSAIGIGVLSGEKLEYKTYLPQFVYAPLKTGDIVGYTVVYCNGYKVDTLPIFADEDLLEDTQNSTFLFKIFTKFLALLRGL